MKPNIISKDKNISKGDFIPTLEEMKMVVDSLVDFAFFITPTGKILAANDAVAHRLNISKNQIIGKIIWDFLHPQIAQERRKQVEKSITTRQKVIFRDFRENMHFQNVVLPFFCQDGTPKSVGVFAENITARINSESSNTLQEKMYKTILKNISDVVILTDDANNIIYISENVSKIFGYSAKEMGNLKNIHQMLPDLTFEQDHLHQFGEISDITCSLVNQSQERRIILVSVKLLPADKVTHLYICKDVTEQKAMQEELEKKDIAITEIIYTIERQKLAVRKKISNNVRKLITPIVDMISENSQCENLINLLRSTIDFVHSNTHRRDSLDNFNLSSREIQICNMIRSGMTIKQIASMLYTSPQTVEKQRKSIRRKIGISEKKINLEQYLKKLLSS